MSDRRGSYPCIELIGKQILAQQRSDRAENLSCSGNYFAKTETEIYLRRLHLPQHQSMQARTELCARIGGTP